jgi:hypothetical protein
VLRQLDDASNFPTPQTHNTHFQTATFSRL